jgi:hypothetical protein
VTLLDRCGADLRRWPEGERDAARALLASDAGELHAARAEAALLDRELDAHEVAAPAARSIERIAGTAAAAVPDRRARSWWRSCRRGRAPAGRSPAWPARSAARSSSRSRSATPTRAPRPTGRKRGTAFTDRVADWSEE